MKRVHRSALQHPSLGGLLVLSLCASCQDLPVATPPAPTAPPSAQAASACDLHAQRARARIDRLRDQGLLAAAEATLEAFAAECPAETDRLAAQRDEIQLLLGTETEPRVLHQQVREGWRLREVGDTLGANVRFSRALAAARSSQQAPARLAVLPAVGPAARLDSSTLVFASWGGDASGALFVDVERKNGAVWTRPFRYVPIADLDAVKRVGPSVLVRAKANSQLFSGAFASGVELPAMDRTIVAGGAAGSVFAGARFEGGVGVFDAATGAARGRWEDGRIDASQRLIASTDGATIATCSGYRGDVIIVASDTGAVKLHERGEQLGGCAEDLQANVLHVLRQAPTSDKDTFDLSLRSFDLRTGERLRDQYVTRSWDRAPYLWVRPADGAVMLEVEDTKKRHFELGKPRARQGASATRTRLADRLPRQTAQSNSNLSFLSHLSSQPWSLMQPFAVNVHTWVANGVLSPDGKRIAVLESKADDELPAVNLLIVDADSVRLEHRVPLGHHASAWTMVEFIDDAYATVRFDWDIFVVHAASGTLRSRVGASTFYDDALVLPLGDDLALSPPELLDLAVPIGEEATASPTRAKDPPGLVELPFSPRSLKLKDGSFRVGEGPPFALDAGDASQAPPWVLCLAREHVLPAQLCASP